MPLRAFLLVAFAATCAAAHPTSMRQMGSIVTAVPIPTGGAIAEDGGYIISVVIPGDLLHAKSEEDKGQQKRQQPSPSINGKPGGTEEDQKAPTATKPAKVQSTTKPYQSKSPQSPPRPVPARLSLEQLQQLLPPNLILPMPPPVAGKEQKRPRESTVLQGSSTDGSYQAICCISPAKPPGAKINPENVQSQPRPDKKRPTPSPAGPDLLHQVLPPQTTLPSPSPTPRKAKEQPSNNAPETDVSTNGEGKPEQGPPKKDEPAKKSEASENGLGNNQSKPVIEKENKKQSDAEEKEALAESDHEKDKPIKEYNNTEQEKPEKEEESPTGEAEKMEPVELSPGPTEAKVSVPERPKEVLKPTPEAIDMSPYHHLYGKWVNPGYNPLYNPIPYLPYSSIPP